MGRFSTNDRGAGKNFQTSPPVWFYEGKCQEKYFPAELKPGENSSWHPAPLARSAWCVVT
jgi:hypothetical protein